MVNVTILARERKLAEPPNEQRLVSS